MPSVTLVSMKSGLGDRNNLSSRLSDRCPARVSMKSGLGDRNNGPKPGGDLLRFSVSMKSGLGDRNNSSAALRAVPRSAPSQ